MRRTSLSIHEAAARVEGQPVRLDQATEITIELIHPTGEIARFARLALYDSDGKIVIFNRNTACPLRLRASVRQTRWPGGQVEMDVLADVPLTVFL